MIHKVGTKNIAALASQQAIPVISACETAKFSAADFLGEPVQPFENLFDLTPSRYISKFITEIGDVEPGRVRDQIRSMLKEMYP